jgi:hypothetical protein
MIGGGTDNNKNQTRTTPQDYEWMNSVLHNYSMEGVTGLVELDISGGRPMESLYVIYSLGKAAGDFTVVLNNRENNEITQLREITWFDGTTRYIPCTFCTGQLIRDLVGRCSPTVALTLLLQQ